MKKVGSYRDSTEPELQQQFLDARTEYFNLKIQQSTGQLENFSRLGELRRDIARIKTVQRERTLSKG